MVKASGDLGCGNFLFSYLYDSIPFIFDNKLFSEISTYIFGVNWLGSELATHSVPEGVSKVIIILVFSSFIGLHEVITASKMKPIIISTGLAELSDIELAVDTCRKVGNEQIILLKCTSSYPSPLEMSNLNSIPDLKIRFNVEVGFSDHTYGFIAPTVAVTLGAKVIEKHFIIDKSVGGPDADFSLDEGQFTKMVNAVRDAEKIKGSVSYDISEKVERNRKFARSLFVVKNIKKGDILSKENIRSIRPGYGMHPKFYRQVLGKTVNRDIDRGTPLQHEFLQN